MVWGDGVRWGVSAWGVWLRGPVAGSGLIDYP